MGFEFEVMTQETEMEDKPEDGVYVRVSKVRLLIHVTSHSALISS